MQSNLERSIEWCEREGAEPAAARSTWDALRLASVAPGLDYFLLDCSLLYGPDVTVKWCERAVGPGGVCGGQLVVVGDDLITAVIDSVSAARKRRMRMERDWWEHSARYVNRLIRVRHRVWKLRAGARSETVGGNGDGYQDHGTVFVGAVRGWECVG